MTHTREEAIQLIRVLIAEDRTGDARVVGAMLGEVDRRDHERADILRGIVTRLWTEVRLYREDAEELRAWFDARIQELDKAEEAVNAGLPHQDPE